VVVVVVVVRKGVVVLVLVVVVVGVEEGVNEAAPVRVREIVVVVVIN